VSLAGFQAPRAVVSARERRLSLEVGFTAPHQLANLLAAVGAAVAVGVEPGGRVEARFGALRGEHVQLPDGVVIINDCYNANPLSMRAALDDLATQEPAGGRRIAILGDMLELGSGELDAHREVGAHAANSCVDVLVTVGPRSAAMAEPFGGEVHAVDDAAAAARLAGEVLRPGDLVLVKGSRGIGLEAVAEALRPPSAAERAGSEAQPVRSDAEPGRSAAEPGRSAAEPGRSAAEPTPSEVDPRG
jgi:UDP-N-acetylmuramoyl-tripeptide--D-alanyl-D-alanine ligase